MREALQKLDAEARLLLGSGFHELSHEERRVVLQIVRHATISRNVSDDEERQMTFGERLADRVARVGGSWRFIIGFGVFLVLWIGVNSVVLIQAGQKPFDPYPYIFLNLMLSMLAAIQAPLIMMSQNRQAAKDRGAAEHDYEVNLKAELEIMALHEKLDGLRSRELADLMAHQIELLREVRDRPAAGLAT